LLDEVDRYPPSAGAEGDPVRLATKRSQTFWNSKKVMVSTPTVKDASRIEAAFLETDQRHFHVPCGMCGHYQVLRWKNVLFDPDKTADARYKCTKCGDLWTDVKRWAAVRKGVWRATLNFNGKAGFHLNELYSSWSTLQGMVENFLEAKKLPETLKTFVNTALAETWEDQGEGIDEIPFMDRRERYKPDFLPNEILLVTAGIDVQDNRLEIETVGWGLGEECWSIEYNTIYGDPSAPGLWRQLDDYLCKVYKRMDGLELPILTAAIDSGGHYTQAVYNFCRHKAKRRIWAIKGQGGQGKAVWPKRPSVRNIGKVPLYNIGVDSAKDIVFARLKVEEKGNGYCHFPMYDEEYFLQLTAEKVVITYSKGVPVRGYKAFRKRNEALDCRVYAYACFVGIQPNLEKVKESQDKWIKANPEKLNPNMKPPIEEGDSKKDEESTKGEQKKLFNDKKKVIRDPRKNRKPPPNFVNSWR
jgi:phage terminase large subunit GpA-like protein